MDADTPTPSQLYLSRFAQARLSLDQAAALVGVHPKTLKRWERGHRRINTAAFRLLKLHAAGIRQSGAWVGWSADEDYLYTPEGIAISAGEIRALPYLLALIAELKRQLNQIRR